MKSKRLLAALLSGVIAVAACGCNNTEPDVDGSETTAAEGAENVTADLANDISSQYEWGNVDIVGGGYVVGLYYNKSEQGLLYARTDIGGAYRMDKETQRWIPLTDRFNNEDYTYYGIDGMATDEKEPNRVYCLAGMYTGWNAAVLCSEDYGETWSITPLEFSCGGNEPNRFADRLMIDPNDNSTIYVGSRNSGLWVSHDYGKSFAKVETFPTMGLEYREDNYNFGITAIAFDPESSEEGKPCQTIYVGTGDLMSYVSKDGGATWTAIEGHPVTYLPHHIYVQDGYVYFVLGNKAGPYTMTQGAIKKYDPANGEWTDISPVENAGHGWGDLEFDPQNPQTMYVSSMGKWGALENDCIWRSTDGGESWTALFEGDGQNRIFDMDISQAKWLDWGAERAKLGWMIGDLEIDPFNSDEIIYGTGATIYRSKNLTKWGTENVVFEVHCKGLEETAVQDLYAPDSDEIRLYSAMGDIDGFTHTDVDNVPDNLNGDGNIGSTKSISAAYNNAQVAVRTSMNDDGIPMAVTQDGGKTWTQIRKPKDTGKDSGVATVNCDGTVIYWTNIASAAVYRTEDFGESWIKSEKAMAKPVVEADCFNPDVVYAYTNGNLYISRDRGVTFKSSPLFIPEGCTLTPSPEKEGDLWLATAFGGVFLVTNYGEGELIRKNMQGADLLAVGAPEKEGGPMTLYAIGTNNEVYGIWRSTDSGESWQRINDDDHQFGAIGTSLAADQRVFGQVYFGSNGRGILMGRLK